MIAGTVRALAAADDQSWRQPRAGKYTSSLYCSTKALYGAPHDLISREISEMVLVLSGAVAKRWQSANRAITMVNSFRPRPPPSQSRGSSRSRRVNMMNFVYITRNFVLKTRNFVTKQGIILSKTRIFVLKMMNFAAGWPEVAQLASNHAIVRSVFIGRILISYQES